MATFTILAFNQAEAEFLFKNRHGDIPFTCSLQSIARAATLCSTDDFPQKGTRKWVTKYYVYQYDYKTPRPDGTFRYMGMRKVSEFDEKTPALKDAREKTLATQQRHTVRIVKVLEDADNVVTDIAPKLNSAPIQFRFSYDE
jgi:hypothetical protein